MYKHTYMTIKHKKEYISYSKRVMRHDYVHNMYKQSYMFKKGKSHYLYKKRLRLSKMSLQVLTTIFTMKFEVNKNVSLFI